METNKKRRKKEGKEWRQIRRGGRKRKQRVEERKEGKEGRQIRRGGGKREGKECRQMSRRETA